MHIDPGDARRGFLKTIAFTAALTCGAVAATAADDAIGQVKTVAGDAYIVRDGSRAAAGVGDDIYPKDIVATGANGAIGITFSDSTVMSAGPGSEVALEDYDFDSDSFTGTMLADMRRGTLLVVSGDIARSAPGAMKVRMPTATLDVHGSRFVIQAPGGR